MSLPLFGLHAPVLRPVTSVLTMRACAGLGGLPPLLSFPGEVFILRASHSLRQLGISAVVRQDQDHIRIRLGTGARN